MTPLVPHVRSGLVLGLLLMLATAGSGARQIGLTAAAPMPGILE